MSLPTGADTASKIKIIENYFYTVCNHYFMSLLRFWRMFSEFARKVLFSGKEHNVIKKHLYKNVFTPTLLSGICNSREYFQNSRFGAVMCHNIVFSGHLKAALQNLM